MSRWIIALSISLSLLTALMPIGLCPCWLLADVKTQHPHPGGDPESQHSHNYLFDLFQSDSATIPPMPLTVHELIAGLRDRSLWQSLASQSLFVFHWVPTNEPPPPRP